MKTPRLRRDWKENPLRFNVVIPNPTVFAVAILGYHENFTFMSNGT
jgi:flagellar biosynthesis protein FlhB